MQTCTCGRRGSNASIGVWWQWLTSTWDRFWSNKDVKNKLPIGWEPAPSSTSRDYAILRSNVKARSKLFSSGDNWKSQGVSIDKPSNFINKHCTDHPTTDNYRSISTFNTYTSFCYWQVVMYFTLRATFIYCISKQCRTLLNHWFSLLKYILQIEMRVDSRTIFIFIRFAYKTSCGCFAWLSLKNNIYF